MPSAENSSQSPVPAEPAESTGVTPIDTERLRALLAALTNVEHGGGGRRVAEVLTALPALLDEVDRLRDGLLTIVNGHQCEAYIGRPYCRDEDSGKQRDARYGADRWCDTCIALDALAGAATPDPEGAK